MDENNVVCIRDEAALIVELFEDVHDKYGIKIPSPEDDEREPDNEAKLYGATYGNLMDEVEDRIWLGDFFAVSENFVAFLPVTINLMSYFWLSYISILSSMYLCEHYRINPKNKENNIGTGRREIR